LLGGFRVEVIPNGLDLSLYQPMNKNKARALLGLPTDKQLILFGAMGATDNKRKGFGYLQTALQELAKQWGERAVAMVFGASQPKKLPNMGLPTQYLGQLQSDDQLVALYSAADVFVAPSVQENLSNTVMESLACATPGVAFNIGGMPDMIEHKKNGYLAKPYQSKELAKGIAWVLEDQARWQSLSQRARTKVEQEFELSHIARRYLALYEELLTGNQTQKRATL
jgi:glycosyltransferase involved in cell wall biosynthesis